MTPTITDPATAPTVAPVIGKRARLRNGIETQPMCMSEIAGGTYHLRAYVSGIGNLSWTDTGQFDIGRGPHKFDIIAILDDEAAPDPQPEAEVAAITGYRIGTAFFSVEDGLIFIRESSADTASITPAEARALLSVLPGLIKIAEGR